MNSYNGLSVHTTMSRFLLTTVVVISLAGFCFPNPTLPSDVEIKNVTSTILPTVPLTRSTKILKTLTSTETTTTKENVKTTKVLVESTTASGRSTTTVQPSTKRVAKIARKQKSNNVAGKSAGKSVGKIGAVGKLEERLGAVDCELPVLPRESRLWRGNETHELNLPITVGFIITLCVLSVRMTEECGVGVAEDECPPVVVSWEGSADVQSGDVLIVRIADSALLAAALNHSALRSNTSQPDRIHRSPTQPTVYQVTRLGHEHCDISDGMMLDITPLAEQDAKIFTLYDKDLTEGVNLLIVVSENWGPQCVRLKVTVKSDNCGDSQDCSGKGVCYTNVSMEGYECQCCPGYIGPHCEEKDDCNPSPCLNNGICVDLTQTLNGANYHCLCPYGFTGRKCEKDPCFSAPCLNGGSCMSMAMNGSTTFHCACADGWTGAHCDLSVAGGVCAANPCVNGICIEQTDEDVTGELYRCFCQPGYTGDHCELEYNECESSPCINGGTCTDRVGGFTCSCGRGYTGATCQKKVDLCSPMPCNEKQFCVDHGNTYTCECPHGYVGEECHLPARSICDNNPCAHGGTCWSDVDSFYCSCRPGYTGKLCEEDFILESVVSGEEFEEPRGGGSVRESHLPLGLYHDRLHNVYIAAGTLGAAIAIVGVVVTACHCRVNKTYSRFLSRLTRATDSGPPHHWLEDKRTPSLAPFPPPSGLDTSDMYYTLDFSDSQSSPLIQ